MKAKVFKTAVLTAGFLLATNGSEYLIWNLAGVAMMTGAAQSLGLFDEPEGVENHTATKGGTA